MTLYHFKSDLLIWALFDAYIETAKANGLDPYKYLTTIFTYLPSQDLIKNPEIIDEVLPWSEFVQKNCK